MLRSVRYIIETLFLIIMLIFFRMQPLDMASAVGGWIGRKLGPRMQVHKVARRNIEQALPELSQADREKALLEMWDNLGRTCAEYAHLSSEAFVKRVKLEGEENYRAALKLQGTVIFFSGHFANWEVLPKMAYAWGSPLLLIYRPANNMFVNWFVRRVRGAHHVGMFAKGINGAMQAVRAIKRGQHLGMLIDQKMNDGIPVPFFGRDAMTAPAIAQLALKYDLALLPATVVRTGGAHFTLHVYPHFKLAPSSDQQRDIREAMLQINKMLEGWIRANPGQWFWVHKRWPKESA